MQVIMRANAVPGPRHCSRHFCATLEAATVFTSAVYSGSCQLWLGQTWPKAHLCVACKVRLVFYQSYK